MVRRKAIACVMAVLSASSQAALAQTETQPEPGGTVDLAVSIEGTSELAAGEDGIFVITARNEGPEPATRVTVSISLPEGLDDTSLTIDRATAECRWDDYAYARPEGTTAESPGSSGGYATCDLGELAVGEAVRIDIRVVRTRAYEMYVTAWVGSFEGDTDYNDNYSDRFIAADASRPADLSVDARAREVSIGETFNLRLTAANAGPSVAEMVDVTAWIPDGTELVSLAPNCIEGAFHVRDSHPELWMPPTVTCRFEQLPAGSKAGADLGIRRTSGWEIYGSAWVGSLNLDENPTDDYATWTMPSDPSVTSDLSVVASGPAATPLVGDTFTLSYTVANSGPTAAGDVTLTDHLAYGLDFVSASDGCTFTDYSVKDPQPVEEGGASGGTTPIYYGGGMVTCDAGLLDVGVERTFDVTLKRSSAYPMYDYAYVSTSNYDPRYENNYAETFIDADRTNSADLAVSVQAPSDAEIGTPFTFTLTVSNLGTRTASGVVLHDYIAEGLEFRSVDRSDLCTFEGEGEGGGSAPSPDGTTPTYAAPRDLICSLGQIEPGTETSVQVEVVRTSDWWIWNGAWIYSESFDPDYTNDYAYFELPGEDPYADCSEAGGSSEGDVISSDTCPVESGGGMDSVALEVGASERDRSVVTGRGADVVNVDVRTGSTSRRLIEIRTGRGRDTINVTVGAVAGNARIVIYAGSGADSVTLDAAPGAIDVVFVVRLGRGEDSLSYIRYGDRSAPPLKLWGGPDADRLVGGQGPDVIHGDDGPDRIDAGAGDDTIVGGRGRDTCIDGPGADKVTC